MMRISDDELQRLADETAAATGIDPLLAAVFLYELLTEGDDDLRSR